MIAPTAPLTEVTNSAIQILCKEIGVVNTARFLNQYSSGHGNYTEDRDTLLESLTVDEIVEDIQRQKAAGSF